MSIATETVNNTIKKINDLSLNTDIQPQEVEVLKIETDTQIYDTHKEDEKNKIKSVEEAISSDAGDKCKYDSEKYKTKFSSLSEAALNNVEDKNKEQQGFFTNLFDVDGAIESFNKKAKDLKTNIVDGFNNAKNNIDDMISGKKPTPDGVDPVALKQKMNSLSDVVIADSVKKDVDKNMIKTMVDQAKEKANEAKQRMSEIGSNISDMFSTKKVPDISSKTVAKQGICNESKVDSFKNAVQSSSVKVINQNGDFNQNELKVVSEGMVSAIPPESVESLPKQEKDVKIEEIKDAVKDATPPEKILINDSLQTTTIQTPPVDDTKIKLISTFIIQFYDNNLHSADTIILQWEEIKLRLKREPVISYPNLFKSGGWFTPKPFHDLYGRLGMITVYNNIYIGNKNDVFIKTMLKNSILDESILRYDGDRCLMTLPNVLTNMISANNLYLDLTGKDHYKIIGATKSYVAKYNKVISEIKVFEENEGKTDLSKIAIPLSI